MIAEGALNHSQEYGHNWKGNESKDTASHLEASSLIPGKVLSFQTGPQHGDGNRPLVRRKAKKKGSGLLPGTIAGRKMIRWQGANQR